MTIHPGRLTAAHGGPLVVFVIGLRINRFLRPGKWLPVARAMGPATSSRRDARSRMQIMAGD